MEKEEIYMDDTFEQQLMEYSNFLYETLDRFIKDMNNIVIDDFTEYLVKHNTELVIALLDSFYSEIKKYNHNIRKYPCVGESPFVDDTGVHWKQLNTVTKMWAVLSGMQKDLETYFPEEPKDFSIKY